MSGVLRFDQLDTTRQRVIQQNLAALKSKGASDDEIESYLKNDEKLAPVAPTMAASDATAYNPTSSGSVIPNLVRGARDLAVGAVKAPIESFLNTVAAPGVGEARPNPNLSKGGNSAGVPLNQPAYDAEHGAVTSTQRTQAGLQSMANTAALGLGGAGTGARLATNAAIGATYDPDSPFVGAALGLGTGEVLHGGGRALGKAGSAILDASGARPTSYAGTPTLGATAQRLLGPLLKDPSEFQGLPKPQGPVMPDALRGEVPELASRRITGPDPEQPPGQPMGRTLLRSTARAMGVESTEQRSLGMILDAMNRDGLSLNDAVQRVSSQTGAKPETLMDIAGQNMIGLARGASMVPNSVAKNDVPQRLFERSTGQHQRLMSDAEELAGLGQPENARKTVEQILTDRNAAADEAGSNLRQMAPQQIPGLEQLAGRPSIQSAEHLARGYALEQGKSMPPIFSEPTQGNITVTPAQMREALEQSGGDHMAAAKLLSEQSSGASTARPLSFEEVQWLKRAMDSNSQAARRFGQGPGPAMQPMTSSEYHQGLMGKTTGQFLQGADQAFPGYGELRHNYGDATSLAKATEWGKDLLRKNPDDAEVEFGQMGPAEQEMARRGGLRALQNYIEGKADARDVTGALEPTTMQRRLKLLFGDNYDAFGQRLGQEARMNVTRGSIRGQSNTADKLAELAQVTGFSLDDVANLATGNVTGLAKRLLTKTAAGRQAGYTQAIANQLSDRLTAGSTPAARSLPDVLQELQAYSNNRFLKAASRGARSRTVSGGAANAAGQNDPFR